MYTQCDFKTLVISYLIDIAVLLSCKTPLKSRFLSKYKRMESFFNSWYESMMSIYAYL